jgi:hypothetical protein
MPVKPKPSIFRQIPTKSYPQFIPNFEKIDQVGCLGGWLWYNRRMERTSLPITDSQTEPEHG